MMEYIIIVLHLPQNYYKRLLFWNNLLTVATYVTFLESELFFFFCQSGSETPQVKKHSRECLLQHGGINQSSGKKPTQAWEEHAGASPGFKQKTV